MDEALIAQIVARVMALLNSRQAVAPRRNVLAIFSGASAGQQEGLEAIRQLAAAGHNVTAVLSGAGRYLVGEERAQSAGASRVIGPDTWVCVPELVREADLVLIPALSMNLAAHLALGLLDSLPSTLVIGALLAGKPVVAVRDGADPAGSGGQVFGANNAAPALRARLAGNLKTLASYGIELVGQGEFLAAVQRHVQGRGISPSPVVGPNQPHVAAGILTHADLANLEPGAVLHLAPGTRLTPLAYETVARLGITIENGSG